MEKEENNSINVFKSLKITQDQQDWLKKHPEINFSALVREAIDDYMKRLK